MRPCMRAWRRERRHDLHRLAHRAGRPAAAAGRRHGQSDGATGEAVARGRRASAAAGRQRPRAATLAGAHPLRARRAAPARAPVAPVARGQYGRPVPHHGQFRLVLASAGRARAVDRQPERQARPAQLPGRRSGHFFRPLAAPGGVQPAPRQRHRRAVGLPGRRLRAIWPYGPHRAERGGLAALYARRTHRVTSRRRPAHPRGAPPGKPVRQRQRRARLRPRASTLSRGAPGAGRRRAAARGAGTPGQVPRRSGRRALRRPRRQCRHAGPVPGQRHRAQSQPGRQHAHFRARGAGLRRARRQHQRGRYPRPAAGWRDGAAGAARRSGRHGARHRGAAARPAPRAGAGDRRPGARRHLRLARHRAQAGRALPAHPRHAAPRLLHALRGALAVSPA